MNSEPQDNLVDRILARLKSLLPAQRPIPLHEPVFETNSWQKVKDCLDSGWVSTAGSYVDDFEQGLVDYTGIPHAVATVNGTAALHTCLLLSGVKHSDEILMPALTFVGTANPVAAMGAIPHFIDSAIDNLGVDPIALAKHLDNISEQRDGVCFNKQTGRPIRALIVVHVLGHIADMPTLRSVANKHGLKLIEDAAEALGSFRDGHHAGYWGDLTALSFNGNKIITTGGGGAILTHDTKLALRARHLTTTAKLQHPWAFEHDEVAFNYRLPNLNAALGVAQLEQLPTILAAKRRLATDYQQAFADTPDVICMAEPDGCNSNYWLSLILLSDEHQREALLAAAHQNGLLLRPFWVPLHCLPMYQSMPRAALPVTEDLYARGVCLPSSSQLAHMHEVTA